MRETDEQVVETEASSDGDAAAPETPGAADQDAAEERATAEVVDDEVAGPGDAAIAGDGGADEQALQGDVDELLQAVTKRDEYLALAQRTQADFENYRKRVARESALTQQRGVGKLAKELLPALDNLDRAIDAAAEGDPLLEGVKLVRKELGAALARLGIEPFSPKGEPFDPSLHEAVAQRPVDGAESGCVAEVYQAGYRLGEQVIRPARVLVAA